MELADLIRSMIKGEIILYTIFVMYTAIAGYLGIIIFKFLFDFIFIEPIIQIKNFFNK